MDQKYSSMTYLTDYDWNKIFVSRMAKEESFKEYFKEKSKIYNDFLALINRIFNLSKNPHIKLKKRILHISLIFFHKYLLFNGLDISNLSYINKISIYIACLFLSFKSVNKLLSIEYISRKFFDLFNKDDKNDIEDIKNLIKKKEFDILLSIGFNVEIDYPFDKLYLIEKYLANIGKSEYIKNVANFVNIKLNDSLLFPFGLYFQSTEIILSCLILVIQEYNINYIKINEIIKLNNLEDNKDNILQCSKYIDKIIKYRKSLIKENNNLNNKEHKIINSENFKINFENITLIKSNN